MAPCPRLFGLALLLFAAAASARHPPPEPATATLHDVKGRAVEVHIYDPCQRKGPRVECGESIRIVHAPRAGAAAPEAPVTLAMARAALGGDEKDGRSLAGVAPLTPPGSTQRVLEVQLHRPSIGAGRMERVWFVPDGDGWRAIYSGLIGAHDVRATHSWTAPGGRQVACEAQVETVARCALKPDPWGPAIDGWPPLRERCVETTTGGCIDGLQLDAARPGDLRDTNCATSRAETALRLVWGREGYAPDDRVALDGDGEHARYLPGPCGATRTVDGQAPETLKVRWRGTKKVWSQLPMDTGAAIGATGTVAFQREAVPVVTRFIGTGEPPKDGLAQWGAREAKTWVESRLVVDGYASHTYDDAGRRVATLYRLDPERSLDSVVPHRMGDGETIRWGRAEHAYDDEGRRIESRWFVDDGDAPQQVTTYRYGPRGRLLEQKTQRTETQRGQTVTFTYDAAGHLVRRDVNDDVRSTEIRRYDDGNLVERLFWEGAVEASPTRAPDVHIAYDYGCWSR